MLLVPVPAVMVPPAEMVQTYPVIPGSVTYTLFTEPEQTWPGPVMVLMVTHCPITLPANNDRENNNMKVSFFITNVLAVYNQ
jgi:hypothetical protein